MSEKKGLGCTNTRSWVDVAFVAVMLLAVVVLTLDILYWRP
jgi:hypothetical protein